MKPSVFPLGRRSPQRSATRLDERFASRPAAILETRREVGEYSAVPAAHVKDGKPGKGARLHWTMGREVKLPGELLRATVDLVSHGKEAEARWKISARFIVRGHWRNQFHGAGRQLRHRIWVQPYWKGPTGAEALKRLYTVDLPKGEP